MAWTNVEFLQNTSVRGLGAVTVRTDDGFSYKKERVNITKTSEVNSFISGAKVALTKSTDKKAEYTTEKDSILTSLNS